MVLEVSIKDEKAELFIQLLQELKSSVIEKFQVLSTSEKDNFTVEEEKEILKRYDEIKTGKIKPLSMEEAFDGIC